MGQSQVESRVPGQSPTRGQRARTLKAVLFCSASLPGHARAGSTTPVSGFVKADALKRLVLPRAVSLAGREAERKRAGWFNMD